MLIGRINFCSWLVQGVPLNHLVVTLILWFTPVQFGLSYISPNQVFFVLDDPPRCDADSTDFPSGLGRMVFQGISDMADHS